MSILSSLQNLRLREQRPGSTISPLVPGLDPPTIVEGPEACARPARTRSSRPDAHGQRGRSWDRSPCCTARPCRGRGRGRRAVGGALPEHPRTGVGHDPGVMDRGCGRGLGALGAVRQRGPPTGRGLLPLSPVVRAAPPTDRVSADSSTGRSSLRCHDCPHNPTTRTAPGEAVRDGRRSLALDAVQEGLVLQRMRRRTHGTQTASHQDCSATWMTSSRATTTSGSLMARGRRADPRSARQPSAGR